MMWRMIWRSYHSRLATKNNWKQRTEMGAATTRVENLMAPGVLQKHRFLRLKRRMVFCGRLKMDISGEMG